MRSGEVEPVARAAARTELAADLSRREFVTRASVFGLAAVIAGAAAATEHLVVPEPALAAGPSLTEATQQAFFDTMIPGRIVASTQSGKGIDPKAILGVHPEPGAVEADALELALDARLGFNILATPFLAELATRSLAHGGQFLDLDWAGREAVATEGLAFSNPTRQVWEAGAAVAFTAFCAAATVINATAKTAVGYRVMGHPGTAPHGYLRSSSYKRKLNRGRTKHGNLP